jgi:hypothetical protein
VADEGVAVFDLVDDVLRERAAMLRRKSGTSPGVSGLP